MAATKQRLERAFSTFSTKSARISVDPDPSIIDFDSILEMVKPKGRYQKLLLYAFLTPVIFLVPFFQFSSIFMVDETEHWCRVPGMPDEVPLDLWRNLTLPMEPDLEGTPKYSKCRMYIGIGNDTDQCFFGWEYDRKDYEETMVSQFDWVCDKAAYGTYALTVNSLGNAVGTILFGRLADQFGRKPIFFVMYGLSILMRVISVFVASNYSVFLVCQFMVGAASALTYAIPAMLACEVSEKDFRAWIYSYTWSVWVLGFAALPGVAYFSRRWDIIGFATSIPGLIVILYWSFVVESPRWLASVGRVDEAAAVLQRIGVFNGQSSEKIETISELLQAYVKAGSLSKEEGYQENAETGSLCKRLLKNWRLLKNLALLTLMCSANMITNYGITLNTTTLYGNRFLNYFILAVMEFPAAALGGFVGDKFGRRWTQVVSYSVCAACCVCSGVYYVNHFSSPYFVIGFAVLTKFAITVTFLITYLQLTEMFPTAVRSTCSGFSSTVAYFLTSLTPFIVEAGKKHHAAITYGFFATLLIFTAAASSFLPETNKRNLPETVEEANKMGKYDRYWSLRPRIL